MQELTELVVKTVQDLFSEEVSVELTRPDEQFGDYATNVALRLSKKIGQNPRDIAQKIADELKKYDQLTEVSVADPGFINITLTEEYLLKLAQSKTKQSLKGQVIVAEYSDPNPFKILHAGHLYTTLVGDTISRLLESAGATVHRVNFGGDVGLHVGQTMWRILHEVKAGPKDLTEEHVDKVIKYLKEQGVLWVSARYILGNRAYEEDDNAKEEIQSINKLVYKLHAEKDTSSPFAKIYWLCRDASYRAFDDLYEKLGVKPFEKYYPESEVADLGVKVVQEHVGDVYEVSDGAVVFNGEKYGLFTQVFINSKGLPTYAGKDVGLIYHKHEDFHQDRSFIITDVAQKDHLGVVMKSIEQYAPELVERTTHLTHGRIKLAGGVKMSSRKGNFVTADAVLDAARAANENGDEWVSIGAVKYAFSKQRIGGDIIYEPAESVSLQGNSGPYLQYAHARAKSILGKAQNPSSKSQIERLEAGERSLVRKLSEYAEVVEKATAELMPHYICTYLYELAQTFNRFYEQNRVVGDERENVRVQLVSMYADTLKNGLELLGIHAPDKM